MRYLLCSGSVEHRASAVVVKRIRLARCNALADDCHALDRLVRYAAAWDSECQHR